MSSYLKPSRQNTGPRVVTGVDSRDAESRSPWFLGILEGAQAAVIGVVATVLLVLLAWLFSSASAATLFPTISAGAAAWLLIHGVPLQVGDLSFSLTPWLLAVIPLAAASRAGRRLTVALEVDAVRRKAARTAPLPRFAHLSAWLTASASYAAVAGVLAGVLQREPLHTVPWQAAAVTAAFALVVVGWGMLRPARAGRERAAGRPRALFGAWLDARSQGRWFGLGLDSVRAAGWAVLVFCGLGLLAALGATAANLHRVGELYAVLGTGVAGGAVLTAGQLALAPNVMVWAASWLAGPGFAVGAGSSVSPAGTTVGSIPAVPLLAAIPDQPPAWGVVAPALIVVAGLVAGGMLLRYGAEGWVDQLVGSAAVAACAGVACGLLAHLSGGAAGPGRLAVVGPDPLAVMAAVAAEVFVGAALSLLLFSRILPRIRATLTAATREATGR